MTTAEEIHGGLGFLIKEAKDIDDLRQTLAVEGKVIVDTYAEHDVFCALLLAPTVLFTDERTSRIQAEMKKLGWDEDDDDLLTFRHTT